MRRYINDQGLVDFHAEVRSDPSRHGWIWLALLVVLILVGNVVLAHWFRRHPGS